jgi:Tfp pilus assembly protein PilZ
MRTTRGAARKRRRFKVLLGSAVSFTTDVSAGGFCTETMRVLVAKSLVKGSIEGLGKKVPFAGKVAWTVPGDSSVNLRGRMGIAFTEVGPELLELLNAQ